MDNVYAIGKEVNYIDLHNFLTDVGAGNVRSHLHEDYQSITEVNHGSQGEPVYYWANDTGPVTFAGNQLKEAATNEQSIIKSIRMQHVWEGRKVTIVFEDHNQISFTVDDEGKYILLLEFLSEYKTPTRRDR